MRTIKKPTKKKVYEADGLKFKSKSLLDFYRELKDLVGIGLITCFELPTLDVQKEKSKYGAIKCMIDEHIFASLLEARYYIYLQNEMKAGRVKSFEMQKDFLLQEKFRKDGKTILPIVYIADFDVTYKDGSRLIIDTKGKLTADFKIKMKMFNFRYRDLKLVCVQYDTKTKQWFDLQSVKKSRKKAS